MSSQISSGALASALLASIWLALGPRDAYLRARSRFDAGEALPPRGPFPPLRSVLGIRSNAPDSQHRTMGLGRTEGAGPDEVASAADLLAVATAAGRPVSRAIGDAAGTIGVRMPGSPLVSAAARIERGCTTAEVLEQLSAVPGWHSLATQLAISAQAGTPAAPALRQLASQERLVARRVRERRARRLPVLLLLPLVALVLPAFLLVTVVPFLAAGGLSLELPPTEDVPGVGPSELPPVLPVRSDPEGEP